MATGDYPAEEFFAPDLSGVVCNHSQRDAEKRGADIGVGIRGRVSCGLCSELITSEVFSCPGVDVVLSALDLPFAVETVRGIVMIDVLHHLPKPRPLSGEAARCVRPGGVIAMIEPRVTPWSRWVYSRLHHEPFDLDVAEWEFPPSGPLSGANGALPYILFVRDRA
jgi:SAM-dependent methyltransferase